MSNDPTDLRPEIARRRAADPLLSQPPMYSHRTWPGYLQQGVQGAPVPTREQFLEATKNVEGLTRADRLAVWEGLPERRGGPKRRAMPHEIQAACQSAGLDEAAVQRVTAAVMAACPPPLRWTVNNGTATEDWRAEYEGLRDRAEYIASDRHERAAKRKDAKRLKQVVGQYLALGTPGKDGNWFDLWRLGKAAENRVAEMDRIGLEMQRLAFRLGLAQVGQPVYVSTDAVVGEGFNRQMARAYQQVQAALRDEAKGRAAVSPSKRPRLPDRYRLAHESYEWACKERPDLLNEDPGLYPSTLHEHVKERWPGYGGARKCPAYATWTRYIREYRLLTAGRKNTPRSGRQGRNVIPEDNL